MRWWVPGGVVSVFWGDVSVFLDSTLGPDPVFQIPVQKVPWHQPAQDLDEQLVQTIRDSSRGEEPAERPRSHQLARLPGHP